ncbi:superoxide reductase [Sporomusaceae bacterium BoRhaA]|uniref:desulfoferrodoxin n=1 Tax=Pelorhabdus rhamnosifermentans TaxID=2772457 RepID=UPI001C0647AF|nr:desulfoferrodoxin [Pelorhabdus rhamnosifermentans]MBU2699820.1 superoxide reductase [Pelorhabdus rhamnosifermentans]
MAEMVFYRCELCGNIVAVMKNGGGKLVCCGQPMIKLDPNTTDAAQEKHVPVVVQEAEKIKVSVGSVAHPMVAEHFIEWIAVVTEEKVELIYLKPGMEPKARFLGQNKAVVYAYCNLHGLWKTEI